MWQMYTLVKAPAEVSFSFLKKVVYFWKKTWHRLLSIFYILNFIQTRKRVCLTFLSSLYFDDNLNILEKLITPLPCVKHEMSIMH